LLESVTLNIEPEDDEAESQANNVIDIKLEKTRKKTKRAFADNLPRVPVVIPVEEHDKTCQCCCQKKTIKHEFHERLNYQPQVYEVIVEMHEVVA
jgi:transposase